MADPAGARIGSGGATLRALASLAAEGEALSKKRVLMIHSGGDSRRLPHCSAVGKLFARVPRVLPDGRSSTLFDEFLISLSGISAGAPPGLLVAAGDVVLVFDHLQVSLQRPGVIGVGASVAVDVGSRHGVYVSTAEGGRVHTYLHKPPLSKLEECGAILDGQVDVDTGLVWLDYRTVEKMAALAAVDEVATLCLLSSNNPDDAAPLNFYGDLVLPLAQSTSFEEYIADCSDHAALFEIKRARREIWKMIRGTDFTVERLKPAMFVHFGSSSEYWEAAADTPSLQNICEWTSSSASWVSAPQEKLTVINAVVEASVSGDRPALIVDSHLRGPVSWKGSAIIANVQTSKAFALSKDLVVHQLPIASGGYVTRIYGLYDDPKQCASSERGTFMNTPWTEWLESSKLSAGAVWPGVSEGERSLWNAMLYVPAERSDDSLENALKLQKPELWTDAERKRWVESRRYSLAESFRAAGSDRLLDDISEVEDIAAARSFFDAVLNEEPASKAQKILGTTPATIARRAGLAAEWLVSADPVIRLRGYRALHEADPAAGYEAAAFDSLAGMIKDSTRRILRKAHAPERKAAKFASEQKGTRVQAAARIDFGGGWTDTPPYSIEKGGLVLNAAVTLKGVYPLEASVERLSEPQIVLESRDIDLVFKAKKASELNSFDDPKDPFALLKAALVLKGVIPDEIEEDFPISAICRSLGTGMKVSTRTFIPRGSGLGASSIMAGAVLMALGNFFGEDVSIEALTDEVLCLEQMLTTGGGWQDQVGGLRGGIKLVSSKPGLPQKLHVEPLVLDAAIKKELGDRLMLVYSGKQRLAKNLLRKVVSRWMARDPEMVRLEQEIASLALLMRDALVKGDLDCFGALLGEHWELNKRFDSTNPFIDRFFDIMKPYMNGAKLAGAGGGGFAIVMARSARAAGDLRAAIRQEMRGTPVGVWDSAIPEAGIRVEQFTGEQRVVGF